MGRGVVRTITMACPLCCGYSIWHGAKASLGSVRRHASFGKFWVHPRECLQTGAPLPPSLLPPLPLPSCLAALCDMPACRAVCVCARVCGDGGRARPRGVVGAYRAVCRASVVRAGGRDAPHRLSCACVRHRYAFGACAGARCRRVGPAESSVQ